MHTENEMNTQNEINPNVNEREINPKADGHPYVEKFNEDYKNMTFIQRLKIKVSMLKITIRLWLLERRKDR